MVEKLGKQIEAILGGLTHAGISNSCSRYWVRYPDILIASSRKVQIDGHASNCIILLVYLNAVHFIA